MISFNNVSMRYPSSAHLFRQVSFNIEKGDFVLVTGQSGAGKSTLLKLMAGIQPPSSGHILINEQDISRLHPNAIPYLRRRFGLVFQDHKLLYDRNSPRLSRAGPVALGAAQAVWLYLDDGAAAGSVWLHCRGLVAVAAIGAPLVDLGIGHPGCQCGRLPPLA